MFIYGRDGGGNGIVKTVLNKSIKEKKKREEERKK